ncbi:hypothetical protein SV7mr_26830 [Stieleria bergensis]|uniref:Uncharacterized protein n=1 Tax=Stieleria bergensis TaxID=2528025 RepID=A0A517SVL4_9BACT|nr:hypothetical protein SV7mr_26830 [Planctomycetes bacterium SV_7m_r]
MATSTAKRFIWKSGKVLSLRLRNGQHTLLQLLDGKWRFAAFNIFRDRDEWDDVYLSAESLLFTNIAVKQFFIESELTPQKGVAPASDVHHEEDRISAGDTPTKYRLWKDSPNEFDITLIGGGPNRLRKIVDYNELFTPIANSEYEEYLHIEMKGVQNYPYLNERLMLCGEFGCNADPKKELMFDRHLPLEYRPYFELLAHTDNYEKYGYNPLG